MIPETSIQNPTSIPNFASPATITPQQTNKPSIRSCSRNNVMNTLKHWIQHTRAKKVAGQISTSRANEEDWIGIWALWGRGGGSVIGTRDWGVEDVRLLPRVVRIWLQATFGSALTLMVCVPVWKIWYHALTAKQWVVQRTMYIALLEIVLLESITSFTNQVFYC